MSEATLSSTKCQKLTAREVAAWIQSLPDEFQDADFTAVFASTPCHLKRVVALKSKDGSITAVCANPMGTHLPFDDSYKWHHVLTD